MTTKTYLLKSDAEFFQKLDAAVADAKCTRADFIRDAVNQKLNHHQTVMKPFFQKMKQEQADLEDEMPVMPRLDSHREYYFE